MSAHRAEGGWQAGGQTVPGLPWSQWEAPSPGRPLCAGLYIRLAPGQVARSWGKLDKSHSRVCSTSRGSRLRSSPPGSEGHVL